MSRRTATTALLATVTLLLGGCGRSASEQLDARCAKPRAAVIAQGAVVEKAHAASAEARKAASYNLSNVFMARAATDAVADDRKQTMLLSQMVSDSPDCFDPKAVATARQYLAPAG